MTLSELGWGHFFEEQIEAYEAAYMPARVYRQDINQYHMISDNGIFQGILPGRLRHAAYSKADLPTVGDWVLTSPIAGGEAHTLQIERRLERKSRFSRQEAGEIVDEQVVAANIDVIFIVAGLDGDFNPGRIERYLLLTQDSGARPIVLLNKADICVDHQMFKAELAPVVKNTPYHLISAKEDKELKEIHQYINAGSTCALIGSSGVGKSTIVNALLGQHRFATGTVRRQDNRGRHTTTFKELVQLPQGGLIIDTPGMRELKIWTDRDSLKQNFDDIFALAVNCKFSDCLHVNEPNCAVVQAIDEGRLELSRLENYKKLEKEVSSLDSQEEASIRTKKKMARRKLTKVEKSQFKR